ncbi:MAG: fibronectin type III domain-containing protein [Candidatus Bathyarchaeota archaeon]|nr:fibronectin type III domain-containing protein [Candidatus Bathyarchaeota archaeon]
MARKRFSTPICCGELDNWLTIRNTFEDLNVIRDGILTKRSLRSLNLGFIDWWGFTFGRTLRVNRVVYYQGDISEKCGWMNLIVQYRDNMGRWVNVSELEIASEGGEKPFGRFIFKFNTVSGTGIRIFGEPKSFNGYTSIAELEIFYIGEDLKIEPTKPTNLKTTLLLNGSVLLEWVDNSKNEFSFRILRKEFWQKIYEEIAAVGTNVNTYIDSETQPFRIYNYIIIAENEFGLSEPSNESAVFSWPPLLGDIRISMLALLAIVFITVIIALLMKTKRLKVEFIREHRM